MTWGVYRFVRLLVAHPAWTVLYRAYEIWETERLDREACERFGIEWDGAEAKVEGGSRSAEEPAKCETCGSEIEEDRDIPPCPACGGGRCWHCWAGVGTMCSKCDDEQI